MSARCDMFARELALVKCERTRKFVEYVIDNLPEYFFHVSASSSGKYHPDFASGEGGLVRHVKADVLVARSLLELEMFNRGLTQDDIDAVYAALILHDGVKRGVSIETDCTQETHPIDMAKFVQRMNDSLPQDKRPDDRVLAKIVEYISSHSGQFNWNRARTIQILPYPKSQMAKFVHLCDYIASRKFMSFDENWEV